jgi:hypothetical protein
MQVSPQLQLLLLLILYWQVQVAGHLMLWLLLLCVGVLSACITVYILVLSAWRNSQELACCKVFAELLPSACL